MIKKPEETEYYINTSCPMEVIRLADWYEVDDEKNPSKVVYWSCALSLMSYMHGGNISWKQRFRHIWHILRKGTPWKDEVILELKEAKELVSRLNKMINTAKEILPG